MNECIAIAASKFELLLSLKNAAFGLNGSNLPEPKMLASEQLDRSWAMRLRTYPCLVLGVGVITMSMPTVP